MTTPRRWACGSRASRPRPRTTSSTGSTTTPRQTVSPDSEWCGQCGGCCRAWSVADLARWPHSGGCTLDSGSDTGARAYLDAKVVSGTRPAADEHCRHSLDPKPVKASCGGRGTMGHGPLGSSASAATAASGSTAPAASSAWVASACRLVPSCWRTRAAAAASLGSRWSFVRS